MICCSGKVKTDKPKNRLVRANKYFVMRIFISLIIRAIRRNYFVKPENHFVKQKNDDVQGCFLRQKTPFKCIIKSDIFAPRASATWCFCGISLGVFAPFHLVFLWHFTWCFCGNASNDTEFTSSDNTRSL